MPSHRAFGSSVQRLVAGNAVSWNAYDGRWGLPLLPAPDRMLCMPPDLSRQVLNGGILLQGVSAGVNGIRAAQDVVLPIVTNAAAAMADGAQVSSHASALLYNELDRDKSTRELHVRRPAFIALNWVLLMVRWKPLGIC